VSVASLARYRRALGDFVKALPMSLQDARHGASLKSPADMSSGWLEDTGSPARKPMEPLKAIEGGAA